MTLVRKVMCALFSMEHDSRALGEEESRHDDDDGRTSL